MEKFLYVVRDYDNSIMYVVRAESREKAMDLINNYTGLDKEDWIVDMADNDNGSEIEVISDKEVKRESVIGKEIEEYRAMVLEAIAHHFTNPFCARTNNGKVMYEKEIMNLINSVEIL